MRNPALFLLNCFLFVCLLSLPHHVLAQSNPTGKDVFIVTEGSKLYSQASDIVHFKPSDYTGSPWNFPMADLLDSNGDFMKSASFWVRHNFTSAPASEVRLIRAASTVSKAPVIATDAHFLVYLEASGANIQIKLKWVAAGTTPATDILVGGINLKAYTWYGIFISRASVSPDSGVLFIYDPSTISGSAYTSSLVTKSTGNPSGYSKTPALSSFYIDIGGDTQISSPSTCEIANFNFLYKKDYVTAAATILELMKQPARLFLWHEYREIDSDIQLIKDLSNENNVAFRGSSQFDTNQDTTLNYYQSATNDVGHIYNQNGFDTIFPAFDLGREFAVSFWIQFNQRPASVTTDTNQIVFYKQNTQYSKMKVYVGFVTTPSQVTGVLLQCGATSKTENLPAAISRTDGKWYYFYVYFANYRKNTTDSTLAFHPSTLYNIKYTNAAGATAALISGILADSFTHGGTNDLMRIGNGVTGNNENLYAILKKFQIFKGGWIFDISADPSSIAIGGARTTHITKGLLSSRVFSQTCASTYSLQDNDCLLACNPGSYAITADVNYPHCETCFENCKTCTGRKQQQCQSCFYGNWDPFGIYNCLSPGGKKLCNTHQYDAGNVCNECNDECASCKDTTQCTACPAAYAYNIANHQCEVPTCGDGVVVAGEECDDGNQFDGDGCTIACKIELGFNCPVNGGACASVCGDNVRASNEACDDGNNIAGDGCDPNCKVEDSYFCTLPANIGPFYGAYKENCATCQTPNPTFCKTCASATACAVCASPNYLDSSSGTPKCVASCPTPNYYANAATSTCKACPYKCAICSSDTVCTQCTGTYPLLGSSCVDNCPDGQYNGIVGGIHQCVTCPAHCITCSSATSCYTCETGYYLVSPGATPGLCQQCDSTCATCRGNAATDCIQCIPGYTLQASTSKCRLLSCATNEYANYANGECEACHASCATCFNTQITGCLTCPAKNGLTVSNKCFNCDPTVTKGLYLTTSNACREVCGDGMRILKTTQCDDGNTIDGDGCSSTCMIETNFTCTGGSETTADTCTSLYGPRPIITINPRDPTWFQIGFDKKVVNTLQESEYVSQIDVQLEGLETSQRLYRLVWNPDNQTFSVRFDLTTSAVDSLLTIQFRDPTRITDIYSNPLSTYQLEAMYPVYYFVDADTRKMASDLSTFSIVIQAVNTAAIIPLALTGYLNHYWLFLEFFQVVHDLVLINIRTPYLAKEFFNSFRFMQMSWLPNALKISNLQFDRSSQLGANKFNDELVSTYFLENAGYQITTWVFLMVVWLSFKIIIRIGLKNTWLKQIIYSVMINLEWSIVIRAVIILFFDFCIYSFLQLTNLSTATPAMTASSIMAIVATVFIALFPCFSFYKTLQVKNQYLLTTDTKFDTFYREYKKRHKSTITFLTISLFQKAIVAAFLVGLQNVPELQIGLLALEQLIMLMLVLFIRPYLDGSMNFRAVIQELILFAVIALFYGLLNENTDELVRNNVGKVIVALIIVSLIMHLLFLLKDSYLAIKNHIKRPSDQKQIFGKVRISPSVDGPDEFQLNNGDNSERMGIPVENNSPDVHGDTTYQDAYPDAGSPETPTKQTLFKY